ncbi:MAG TPA: iron-sulfur cluster assembly scaffold protein [Terriglobales bacterium]|jgi:nitrogen fixation NifU-like protein|nr:iron-sulfur cluster assembly scaffold protein [Terriglobales bacterium]
MYSPQLLEHFEHPRNVGELAQPDAEATIDNPACGDVMTLQLRIEDGRIAEAKYRVKGCAAAIACGSALTELIAQRSLADARALRREQIISAVGGLPPASAHASHLAFDALQAVLHQLPQ